MGAAATASRVSPQSPLRVRVWLLPLPLRDCPEAERMSRSSRPPHSPHSPHSSHSSELRALQLTSPTPSDADPPRPHSALSLSLSPSLSLSLSETDESAEWTGWTAGVCQLETRSSRRTRVTCQARRLTHCDSLTESLTTKATVTV